MAKLARRISENPAIYAGGALLAVILLMTLSANYFYPANPLNMVSRPFLAPTEDMRWPLGTDSMGRDILAGILYGARISVLVGIASTVLGLAIGILVGAVAGYVGGRVDSFLVRIIEVFQTFPPFLLVIVLVAILNPSIASITFAIGIVSWPTIARIVRSEFRALKNLDFVLAARAAGYGDLRIAVGQILPNAVAPVIVTASVMVASAILIESALSFLGLGDPNRVSWGSMIGSGRDQLRTAWYIVTLPGIAIVITVLSLNLLADGLNNALNPRKR